MTLQLRCEVLRASQVPVEDVVVATARAQESIIPGYRANPLVMTLHSSNQLILGRVPDLQLACVGSNGEMLPIPGPLHRGDVVVGANITQLRHLAVHGGPQVDAGAEADGKDVLGRPVDEVQVEIVLEAGGVEHLKRLLWDHPLLLVLL